MTTERTRGRVAVAVAGLVVAVTLVAGVVGYAVSARTGIEEATLLAITFSVSPVAFALYGLVATVTFLATLGAVLFAVEKIEEDSW